MTYDSNSLRKTPIKRDWRHLPKNTTACEAKAGKAKAILNFDTHDQVEDEIFDFVAGFGVDIVAELYQGA